MIRGHRVKPTVSLTVSATQTSQYNLFTAAGSPSVATDVYLTINTGVVLERGLLGTGFPTGSTVTIVNNGRIAGLGGAGAAGTGFDGSSNFSVGGPGSPAGHAIETNVPTTVDNTNGELLGGGGGGGGGGGTRRPIGGPYTYRAGGGGGGGGRGYNNAAAGAGGVSVPSSFENGLPGTAGSSAAQGIPGAGSNDAGSGGYGGDWGSDGGNGNQGAAATDGGYPGGAAGQAVKTNGAGAIITGGNNGTQIRGVVA